MNLNALPPNVRSKIDVRGPDECWPWTGALSSQKYGHVKHAGRIQESHRVIYTYLVGPIPPGVCVDHLCHTPSCPTPGPSCPHRRCCNPAHMSLATRVENTMRGSSPPANNARRTHCAKGHEYTPENTKMEGGARRCVICRREIEKRRGERRKQQRRERGRRS